MIKLIPASEKHINQLAVCMSSTSYYEATAKYNLLKLSVNAYIQDYRIKSILPITTVAVKDDDEDTVLGMITCASTKQLKLYNCKSYSHPQIKEIFRPFSEFEIPESYHISILAVSKAMRGNGVGRVLMQYAETKAKENGLNTLSLLVWNCQTSAIKLYSSMGMMITKTINFNADLPFKILLYFEKTQQLTALQNYFETADYSQLELLK